MKKEHKPKTKKADTDNDRSVTEKPTSDSVAILKPIPEGYLTSHHNITSVFESPKEQQESFYKMSLRWEVPEPMIEQWHRRYLFLKANRIDVREKGEITNEMLELVRSQKAIAEIKIVL